MSTKSLFHTIPDKYQMDLKAIKKALPTGGLTKVAERAKVSLSYASYVLSGKRQNIAVIEAAISIIEEEKERQKSLNDRLKAAIDA